VYYLQLEVTGKVVGNFDLVMSISSQSSSTRIIYKAPGQANLQNIDGQSSFKNVLSSFSGSPRFDSSKNIFPNFPTNSEVLVTFEIGSVNLKAYSFLVVSAEVTGASVFTAQAGAFANAQTRVALYVFEKIREVIEYKLFGPNIYGGTCTAGYVHNPSICNQVLLDAGVSENANTMYCSPPVATDTKSGTCVLNKYLIIQIFEPPTFKSGLNGPSLDAKTSANADITVSLYPVLKVSAYNDMFSLFVAPHIQSITRIRPASTGKCAGKMEIQVISQCQMKLRQF
jgi:hypothetical protein